MQGIVVDAKETLVNKMDKVPNPVHFYLSREKKQ